MILANEKNINQFLKKNTANLKGCIKIVKGRYFVFEPEAPDIHGSYKIVKKVKGLIRNDKVITLPKIDYYDFSGYLRLEGHDIIVGGRRLKNIVINEYETTEDELSIINDIENFTSNDTVKIDDILKASKYMANIKMTTNNIYNCVMLENDMIYSIDGYRLIRLKIDNNLNNTYTIQEKFIKLLKEYKKQELKLQKNDNNKMIMNVDDIFIISSCYDNLPCINKMITNKNDINIELDRNRCIEELKFLKKINKNNKEDKTLIIIDFKTGIFETEKATSEIKIKQVEGEINFKIGFNMDYMLDLLKDVPYDMCNIGLDGCNTPMTIRYDNITELALPIRLANRK